ncbi:hypothetical protein ACS5PU_02230 [Pedobacter sp. GSP4]|uniref:hypothetical protein n=1 Tax=Pedobacter sp. GSP4 TaxID=3453716 RepID=UPI003EEC64AA
MANSKSELFYHKWKKDAEQSVFIAAPIVLIICLTCFTLIIGISIKLLLIVLLPLVAIFTGLVYSPLFLRKKYINGMVKKMHFENQIISVETYGWFKYKPICASFTETTFRLNQQFDNPFFKEKAVWVLKMSDIGNVDLYIVEDFFDDALKSLLCKIG